MEKYEMKDIVTCLRNSAMILGIADNDKPNLNKLNCKQAELLLAVADYLEDTELGGTPKMPTGENDNV